MLGESVLVPPGDDLGMIELPGGAQVLAGVDQIVAGIHLQADAPPEAYGRKLVNRSLSDVAAMAAIPVGMVVSAALPSALVEEEAAPGQSWGERFAEAARAVGGAMGCPLFGGDVAHYGATRGVFTASATVLATPDPEADGRILLRSGAQAGDHLYVSGCFGRSLQSDGSGHHLDFTPRIRLACELNRTLGKALSSAIDVSDGLAADAEHIARESGVSIRIDAGLVPRRSGASTAEALTDGEDYELCFTVAGNVDVPEEIEGVSLTRIGSVSAGDGMRIFDGARELQLARTGWEHSE